MEYAIPGYGIAPSGGLFLDMAKSITQHTYPIVIFLHACYISTHIRFFLP